MILKRSFFILYLFIQAQLLKGQTLGNPQQCEAFCNNYENTHQFDPNKHKSVYKVGVLAIRGYSSAYAEFNKTFSEYLTDAVGRKFISGEGGIISPVSPIRFEMKPLNFLELFADVEAKTVDFIYVNPSAYACIEAEHGATSLVSQVSLRKVSGQEYQLSKFGGVIMALANNTSVQKVTDLRGKSIAAASISGLGSGQMQFRKMIGKGMSYINDPKQLVFTSNQGKVVLGVLYGEFDVGFVR